MAVPQLLRVGVRDVAAKAQQLTVKGKQSVSQLAAKTKQDEQQLVAAIKQAVDQLAAKTKQGEQQLVARIKQAVDQLAATTRKDEQLSAAGINAGLAAVRNPTVCGTTVQGGSRYQYDETSEDWKTACLPLPCFTAVQFPGYATAVIPKTINGVATIIQLWKGRCERLCGTRFNFPGGVGAEVGIYLKRQPGDQMWWPAPFLIPGFNTSISWNLVNPSTQTVFLDAPTQTTYWRNRWMTIQSYNLYKQNCNGLVPNYTGYTLNYTINGTPYPPW